MFNLQFTLFFVLIPSLPISHFHVQLLGPQGAVDVPGPTQVIEFKPELPDIPTSNSNLPTHAAESKSDISKSYSTLPLVQIRYFNRFVPPTNIDFSTWKKGEKFLTAETKFSGSIPGMQTFLCGQEGFKGKNPDDKYCSFPVYFEPSDILQCVQEPKPFVKKYQIKDSTQFFDIPCGENGGGKLYMFVYRICTLKNITKNEKRNGISDTDWDPIETCSEFESYRFCYDRKQRQLLYTRHKLQSIDLLTNKELKQERQMSYKMITDGYGYFGSWFDVIERQYVKLEELGYKPIKLVPSNHFPLALWKKPTYHFLNTMPMQKKLIRLWEHIFYLIRQDGIQNNRQYEFHTRALPMVNKVKSFEEIQPPDIWITLIEYAQREKAENLNVSVAIILNNKFTETANNSVTEFITQKYCDENLCEDAFSESFPILGSSIHCCAINDAIKQLFEEKVVVDRTLDLDFLFDSATDTSELEQDQTNGILDRKSSTVASSSSTNFLSKSWKYIKTHLLKKKSHRKKRRVG